MTDHTIVESRRGLPPLQLGKRWKERDHPVALLLALKVLVTVCLIVTLGGCVSTREGDYETPFVHGDQGNGPHAP
jgi:hypothetical protein